MTIHFIQGNLFEANADAIINTVNCVGVMGKGVALEFKYRWPDNYKAYKQLCTQNIIKIGEMFVYDRGGMFDDTKPRFLINFPTKQHWRGKSKIEYIELGLNDLIKQLKKHSIHTVALPPLGCGNGGLDWHDVKPLIQNAFALLPEVNFFVYEPEASVVKTPEYINQLEIKTPVRAVFIKLLGDMEISFGGAFSKLVLQNLVYFLQVAGLKFNVQFSKGTRGPYSEQIKQAIMAMEAQGYLEPANFDKNTFQVSSRAYPAADDFLDNCDDAEKLKKIAERVSLLIEGFESPYGLELLSSVYYILTHENIRDTDSLTQEIDRWKGKQKFPKEYILVAQKRLRDDRFVSM